MKKLAFEYGEGLMEGNFPDSTDVFVPGETVPDPPFLENPLEETRRAILNPVGMEPLSKTAKPGMKVTIVFPDKVKGGFQDTAHRKLAIPIVIEELLAAGVGKEDIRLICSNGLHRKNTKEEIRRMLDPKTFHDFWYTDQIVNHDSEDWDNLVDLGKDELGDPVIMNKEVFDSDIAVLIGHTLANPYGGYSGGYKHCTTGITHWRSIASHHNTQVMHRGDWTPVQRHSVMRDKFDAIGRHMETCMGKKFFTVDAVLDSVARQIAVFAGCAGEIQPLAFAVADKRTYVKWAQKKYDVMVFGMPQNFHYGNGHGTNPILMLQAIGANVARYKRVMRDNCVVICSSICNGYFHDQEFPSYRALYNLYMEDYHNTLPDLEKHADAFCNKQEYIDAYRYNYGFHPFHGFSMISCGHVAEMNTSAIYIVGAFEPGYARAFGMKTQPTFEAALKDAEKYVGESPNVLALPKTFKVASVHLCMEDDQV